MSACAITGCDRDSFARGMCLKHYKRQWRGNDPSVDYVHKRESLGDRFARGYRVDASGCWLWLGGVDRKGYGFIGSGGNNSRRLSAHRVSYELKFGDINDLCVCHRCDVPACVNPDHLFLGTKGDNNRDMWSKGRGKGNNELFRLRPSECLPRGERHHMSKLSEADVLALRRRRAKGESVAALARKLNVSKSVAHAAATGKTWRHVGEPT